MDDLHEKSWTDNGYAAYDSQQMLYMCRPYSMQQKVIILILACIATIKISDVLHSFRYANSYLRKDIVCS